MTRCLIAEEVAEILSVSKPRVYELIRKGTLPSVKIGRQVRVLESALDAWLLAGGVLLSDNQQNN